MHIRAGYNITYDCPQNTPMLLALDVHPDRQPDVIGSHTIHFDPPIPFAEYRDRFDNTCHRIVAPPGPLTISSSILVNDPGTTDRIDPQSHQSAVQDLPDDVLIFLLASRYCETDRLTATAWSLFGNTPPGWARVQAICDFVHNHITFNYNLADRTRSAWGAYSDRVGVCRDFAHLAVTFCRCMNIPARYCTGYLGDIGIPPVPYPGDFSAWFEAWLGDHWHTFDARHNIPRIGRILMARGRDATDVAISTIFGPHTIAKFEVFTDEEK